MLDALEQTVHERRPVSGLLGQRDLLPVQPQAGRRERTDRRPAVPADKNKEELGLWPVLPVHAQYPGPRVEPQTRVPDLPRATRTCGSAEISSSEPKLPIAALVANDGFYSLSGFTIASTSAMQASNQSTSMRSRRRA